MIILIQNIEHKMLKYHKYSAYYEAAKRFEERAKIHNSASNLLSSLSRMHKLDYEALNKQHLFDGFVHSDPHDLIQHFQLNERNRNSHNSHHDDDIHSTQISGYQTPMTMERGLSSHSLPVLYQQLNEIDNDEILSKQEGTTKAINIDDDVDNEIETVQQQSRHDKTRKSMPLCDSILLIFF